MKSSVLIMYVFISSICLQAQSIAGLWQGTWKSPQGFVFEFIMHVEEYPDGNVEGYLIWKVIVASPEMVWYYKDKIGKEATEFVRGNLTGKYELSFEGYKKEDPHSIIDLDKYRIEFDETFNSFTGSTGNHGTWLADIQGARLRYTDSYRG